MDENGLYIDKVSGVDVIFVELVLVTVIFAVIAVCECRSDMSITGVDVHPCNHLPLHFAISSMLFHHHGVDGGDHMSMMNIHVFTYSTPYGDSVRCYGMVTIS